MFKHPLVEYSVIEPPIKKYNIAWVDEVTETSEPFPTGQNPCGGATLQYEYSPPIEYVRTTVQEGARNLSSEYTVEIPQETHGVQYIEYDMSSLFDHYQAVPLATPTTTD